MDEEIKTNAGKNILLENYTRRSIDGFKEDRLILIYKYSIATNDVELQRRVGVRLEKINKPLKLI